ncbi:MAG: hypothetical protein WAU07_04505 [Microgenomates group bacterium]
MKRYTPYLLPLLVLGVVFFLVVRWYNQRVQRVEDSLFAEGIEIENLSQEEAQSLQSAGDFEMVELEPASAESSVSGTIRYHIDDERVRFTVSLDEAESNAEYSVWLKEVGGVALRQAFTLESHKGGLLGSAALPANLLPFEVLVTDQALLTASDLSGVLLRATIEAEDDAAMEEETSELELEEQE